MEGLFEGWNVVKTRYLIDKKMGRGGSGGGKTAILTSMSLSAILTGRAGLSFSVSRPVTCVTQRRERTCMVLQFARNE